MIPNLSHGLAVKVHANVWSGYIYLQVNAPGFNSNVQRNIFCSVHVSYKRCMKVCIQRAIKVRSQFTYIKGASIAE